MSSTPTPGWMPGTDRSQIYGGNVHKATVSKIVLHTTEGGSWPDYGGGSMAPHFTVHRGSFGTSNVRQHIPTTQSAKALEHPSGTPETNNAGVIQIEFIGSCDRSYASKYGLFFTEDATDADLAALAEVVAWISDAHGIPLTATGLSWPTTNAASKSSPQRFSTSEWSKYWGVCGHTHVPNNVHWDPGAFPVSRLLKLAGGADPSGGGTDPGKLAVDGRFGHATSRALQLYLISEHGADIEADGHAGEATWTAFQYAVDAPYKDGCISRQSYRPEELGNGIVDRPTAWQYTGRGSDGSQTIELMQHWVGVTEDGILYEGTTAALQRKLNTYDLT